MSEVRLRASRATPVGPVWVESCGGVITGAGWGEASDPAADALLDAAFAQLSEYFDGARQHFDLPLDPPGSELQRDVCASMLAIPFGHTRTYGEIARDLGVPPQAVGQACGGNPIPILIPCHRVLGANGLGGFSARGGVETKVWLLKHEGAASLLI